MNRQALTVTELTARIKQVLEQGFAQVEVTGEISRLAKPSSGHLYFTIKDAHAAISAVVWRTTVSRLKTRPQEGQAYIFIGHLSLYESRGTYQLIIQRIEALGAGRLAAEFERRKQAFADLGWFDSAHKQHIPRLPQHIGIVASPTSAAYEDVKKVLSTRPAWLKMTLSPCLVQGEQAATTIITALQRLQHMKTRPDVILLVRGGGSIEDLWCFNHEHIVKAIFESDIPIISGVGHEIDTTLADLAADVRAATPSNAAELCCPARDSLRQQLPSLLSMASLLQRRIHASQQQLIQLRLRQVQTIQHTQDHKNWGLERLTSKLQQTFQQQLKKYQRDQQNLNTQLHLHEPNQRLRHHTQTLYQIKHRLNHAAQPMLKQLKTLLLKQQQLLSQQQQRMQQQRQHWSCLHEQLHAMNPHHVLQRGYTMATDAQGKIIIAKQAIKTGDIIALHFHDGALNTKVLANNT